MTNPLGFHSVYQNASYIHIISGNQQLLFTKRKLLWKSKKKRGVF